MDTVGIISSVSKVAVVAFAITLGVVVFEVITLIRKNKQKTAHKETLVVPEFDQAKAAEHHFTELPQIEGAPIVPQEHRTIPKVVLLVGGIGVIVLVTGVAVWIFNKSALAPRKAKKVTSPIAEVGKLTPTGIPTPTEVSLEFPTGTDISLTQSPLTTIAEATDVPGTTKTPTALVSKGPSPTRKLITTTPGVFVTDAAGVTTEVTTGVTITSAATATSAVTGSVTGVSNNSTSTPYVSATGVTSAGVSATAIPTSPSMPQSGGFEATFLISLVSLVLISLAFIL